MSSTERRQHPRVQLDLPLQLTFGEKTFDTRISDISTSGIRFRTPEALPLMTRVQIGLELPSGEESGPVALNGVVVRSDVRPDATGNPDPDGGQYETAIFFDELTAEAQTRLLRFLKIR
ncbi:MAG: PilZ domain-containing protein [Planctomycetota bacterium]|jgi:hypothetical protein